MPILVAHPDSLILRCSDGGIETITYDHVPAVRDHRRFLDDPEHQLRLLLDEPAEW